ncbi:MAG: trypsin-like peptidase domain-containing protein [Corynebacterium sp.]|nr:trypsin-like peptidase domain-containing protein [Corynebacterium sp.]
MGGVIALVAVLSLLLGGVAGGVAGYAVSSPDEEPAPDSGPDNALTAPPADAPETPAGSVEEVADAVLPTVVSIQVVTPLSAGEGSGSIFTSDGYVLTNHHVVDGAEDGAMQVTLNDGTDMTADFVASDAATDIAVIKIRDAENLPTIQFGDSEQLAVGQQVVAVGAPLGLSGTVTSGIVSAMDRPVRASQGGGESSLIDAIQTDAAINPGNSGGPLVDMNGNLVGMNSVIATLSTGNTAGSIGLGFAIPSNFAQRVAEQLIAGGEASQPMLGVTVDGANPVDGALIVGVQPGGPGADAGLEEGEVITRLNDRNIDTSDGLIAAVRSRDFGETVTLEVVDPETDERKEVQVTLSVE